MGLARRRQGARRTATLTGRRRRATQDPTAMPMRPSGSGGVGPSASLPLLDAALCRGLRRGRLASGPTALGTRPSPIPGQAPRYHMATEASRKRLARGARGDEPVSGAGRNSGGAPRASESVAPSTPWGAEPAVWPAPLAAAPGRVAMGGAQTGTRPGRRPDPGAPRRKGVRPRGRVGAPAPASSNPAGTATLRGAPDAPDPSESRFPAR
jgi:hypothetical protein